jgi:anti-sigma regulatory factor (Ser/Thr protein kinase)
MEKEVQKLSVEVYCSARSGDYWIRLSDPGFPGKSIELSVTEREAVHYSKFFDIKIQLV